MDATQAFKRFDEFIAPILALKPVIEQAQAAERQIKDLEARKARAEQELAAIELRVKNKNTDLDNARVAHEKQLENTRLSCVSMREKAKAEGDAIVKEAKELKALADTAIEQVKKDAQAAKSELADIRSDVAKAKEEMRVLQKQRSDALAGLAKIVAGGK